jgi:hypothetical protein
MSWPASAQQVTQQGIPELIARAAAAMLRGMTFMPLAIRTLADAP